jgi:hypothetical protein
MESIQAYYKVLDATELPENTEGDVIRLEKGLGDTWTMFGYLQPCDSTGQAIEPGKQMVVLVANESNGDLVDATGKRLIDSGKLPDGTFDPDSGKSAKADDPSKINYKGKSKAEEVA